MKLTFQIIRLFQLGKATKDISDLPGQSLAIVREILAEAGILG